MAQPAALAHEDAEDGDDPEPSEPALSCSSRRRPSHSHSARASRGSKGGVTTRRRHRAASLRLAQGNSGHQQKPSASSEEINPIYSEISFALHENLSQDDYSDLDSTDVVHSVVYDIIQKGGEAGKIAKGSKKLKLDRGILLDNYVQRGPILVDAQSRSLLIHSKRSKRHMSLKQHKKCGSFDLHDTFRRFDLYKPMHEMWKEYMRELTKSTPKKQLSENLLSADLHGALIIVAQCKAASYQGVSGIMIRDTAETFGIISEDNRFRDLTGLLSKKLTLKPAVVPKAGSVFVLQADCWKVTLIGDKLSPKEKLKESQRLTYGPAWKKNSSASFRPSEAIVAGTAPRLLGTEHFWLVVLTDICCRAPPYDARRLGALFKVAGAAAPPLAGSAKPCPDPCRPDTFPLPPHATSSFVAGAPSPRGGSPALSAAAVPLGNERAGTTRLASAT
ncbi:Ribonuclease P protein subunit p29 [Hordeum vulgare]|nr:Ribonuclease P protein subunit p29 [Hordeum vulgare]